MLKRKIADELSRWRGRPGKKALVVNGARQVGKTYSIEAFIAENYKHAVRLDFVKTPGFAQAFADDLSVDGIVSQISFMLPDAVFAPGDTVVFLDEIQMCPRAISALKYFTLDGRYDVIATGSLLGMAYKEVDSFPVGYIERLEMHGLDFEEFLWARGVAPAQIDSLRALYEKRRQVPAAVHERMLRLFREYMVVGGMPEVVAAYAGSGGQFGEALRLQRGIVRDYADDIAKYAEGQEKTKARECFLSIPKQLARDYKKFQYSVVDKHGSARKYAGSLMWLLDAGLVRFCHNLERVALPLEGNAVNSEFKVYMADTGLLVAMLEDGAQADIMGGNMGIYKGAVFENVVADIFGKAGKKLYYYAYRSQIEVDFVIRYEGAATAVEVKAADHTKSKSMNALIQNHGVARGIKLSSKNVGEAGPVTTLPLYMAMFL